MDIIKNMKAMTIKYFKNLKMEPISERLHFYIKNYYVFDKASKA